jgi:hypothetical protein
VFILVYWPFWQFERFGKVDFTGDKYDINDGCTYEDAEE